MANENAPKKTLPDYYLAMHSPRGANASFALGALDSGGGFMLDAPFVPEQEVFIGLKRGSVITCLPFFKKEEVNLEEAYDIGAAKKKHTVELKKYRPEDVVRRYGMATDTWSVPGLTFSIATPVDGVPDPRITAAETLKRSIMPALPARLTVDNTDGKESLVGIFGVREQLGMYSPGDRAPGELAGFVAPRGFGIAFDPRRQGASVKEVADFSPHQLFARVAPYFYRLGPMGGFTVEVPAGQKKTVDFVFGWYQGGVATRGARVFDHLYKRYFASIEEVFTFALAGVDGYWAEAAHYDAVFAKTPLNADQKFIVAHAMHSYWASTMLFDDGGIPRWVTNEGSYMMMNTFDLSVDHLFYETRWMPWAVKSQLDTFVDEYSYYDTVHPHDDPAKHFPGGIAFTHDQGLYNTWSPRGTSSYEMTNKHGCLSYMSHEQLCNWVVSAAVYYHATRDTEWLQRRKSVIADCLTSLLNRDHHDPARRDGVMDLDSDRCGVGTEITTYDSLDPSLGQSRRNLYLAGKSWASYLGIARMLGDLGDPAYTPIVDEAMAGAHRAANTMAAAFDEKLGYIPAIMDGKDTSAIIPAIEGLSYPVNFGMEEAVSFTGSFGAYVKAMHRHFEGVFKPERCLFSDNGWRLSANSINTWMSKIFLCQYVARDILKIDFGAEGSKHDRAHAHWWQVVCAGCPGIDQYFWGNPYGRGFHYPRAITAVLWVGDVPRYAPAGRHT
jgi:xylan 1,4-beta-xylosidase